MNDKPVWSSATLPPDNTQPSPRIAVRRITAARTRRPIGLYLLTGCLALIVLLCAGTSFVLATIGPGTLLTLRDRWLGRNLQETISTIGQMAQVVVGVGDNSVWPVANNGRLTILLMGIDTRSNTISDPSRTDVITLITIDPISNTAALLSIPRDLYVPLPNLNMQDRINTAYFYGQYYKVPGGAAAYAMQTIGWNLGIPINKYAIIDFEGFKKVVDAVGGVDIDVPHEIIDDAYPTPDYGTERLDIPAGRVHMDGDLALKYVRTRHGDSDFGRLQRQQQVMLAIRDKALSIGSIGKVPETLNAVGDSLETDLSLPEILALAKKWAAIPRENIQTYRIDETLTQPYVTPQGGEVLPPLRDKIAALVAEFLGQTAPPQPRTGSITP